MKTMMSGNRKFRNPGLQRNRRITLEDQTDLSLLRDKKVLVLLDEQNLSITARNLGYELQYRLLARKIRAAAGKIRLNLFTATDTCDQATRREFQKAGYRVHLKEARTLPALGGRFRRDSNVDNIFAFWTGNFVAGTRYDAVVLGSGDYGLSGELSQAIRQQRKKRPLEIMTLSLPGSTAQDLDARKNGNITANLEIGCDVMRPISQLKKQCSAGAPGSSRKFRFWQ